MIRIALIVFGFIAITLTLILMQPSAPGMRADTRFSETPGLNEVSRADSALSGMSSQPHLPEEGPDPITDTAAEAIAEPASATKPQTDLIDTGSPPAARSPETLESLIITALQQGQNDAYIDALVNDAAQKGKVEVPGQLVTADGRVDTSTLLTILSQSPNAMRAGGTLYTVAAGDSLAAISFRFYGTTDRVNEIVDANEAALSHNGLTIGQDLVIPPK